MEEDIEKIKTLIEGFISKYGVTVEIKTIETTRSIMGITNGKVQITIESQGVDLMEIKVKKQK